MYKPKIPKGLVNMKTKKIKKMLQANHDRWLGVMREVTKLHQLLIEQNKWNSELKDCIGNNTACIEEIRERHDNLVGAVDHNALALNETVEHVQHIEDHLNDDNTALSITQLQQRHDELTSRMHGGLDAITDYMGIDVGEDVAGVWTVTQKVVPRHDDDPVDTSGHSDDPDDEFLDWLDEEVGENDQQLPPDIEAVVDAGIEVVQSYVHTGPMEEAYRLLSDADFAYPGLEGWTHEEEERKAWYSERSRWVTAFKAQKKLIEESVPTAFGEDTERFETQQTELHHNISVAIALIRDQMDGNGGRHVAGWMQEAGRLAEWWKGYYNTYIDPPVDGIDEMGG